MPRRSHVRDSKSSSLKPKKPYRLKRWRVDTPTGSAHFFTCARPRRTSLEESKTKPVPYETVHRWVLWLGKLGSKMAIVSLLGQKPDGLSEFWFYSFSGGFDTPSERGDRPTFQEWLDHHHRNLNILVREHPTYDLAGAKTFPPGTLDTVKADIEELILTGHTVIVVDSGGETRTGMVCKHIGAKEDSSSKI